MRLMNGRRVKKNVKESIKYLKISADRSNYEFCQNIGYLLIDGILVEKNYEEAVKYFHLEIEGENIESLYNLSD
jgi:TPR repeat protein